MLSFLETLLGCRNMYYKFMISSPGYSATVRRFVWLPALIMGMLACVGPDTVEKKDHATPPPVESNENQSAKTPAVDSPPKTPQGYIRPDVYQPEKYGGFRGDCSSEENFPYYWECMSENAGNDFE